MSIEDIRWYFVKVYLTKEEIDLVDKLRGKEARSSFLRNLLLKENKTLNNTKH